MPLYTYEHPKTKKQITLVQRMTEEHVYTDEKGVKWNRVFEKPNARIDTLGDMDAFSSKEFMEKTKNKKMTMGSMWDLSAELSAKRAKASGGKDPVKQKTVEAYRKKCKGKAHPQE